MRSACIYCGLEIEYGYCVDAPDGMHRVEEVEQDRDFENYDLDANEEPYRWSVVEIDVDQRAKDIAERKIIWCFRCQCFVKREDLKIWTGDDMLHRLCPGCDADLVEPEIQE